LALGGGAEQFAEKAFPPSRPHLSGCKAYCENKLFIAALNRCATQIKGLIEFFGKLFSRALPQADL